MTSKYFKEYEVECLCGCGAKRVRQTSIARLDCARGIAAIPFLLSSACRCAIHNKNEGGKPDSAHLTEDDVECKGFDIVVTSSRARFKILTALIEAGFTRIGIGKTFIHADDDESKPPEVSWMY